MYIVRLMLADLDVSGKRSLNTKQLVMLSLADSDVYDRATFRSFYAASLEGDVWTEAERGAAIAKVYRILQKSTIKVGDELKAENYTIDNATFDSILREQLRKETGLDPHEFSAPPPMNMVDPLLVLNAIAGQRHDGRVLVGVRECRRTS